MSNKHSNEEIKNIEFVESYLEETVNFDKLGLKKFKFFAVFYDNYDLSKGYHELAKKIHEQLVNDPQIQRLFGALVGVRAVFEVTQMGDDFVKVYRIVANSASTSEDCSFFVSEVERLIIELFENELILSASK